MMFIKILVSRNLTLGITVIRKMRIIDIFTLAFFLSRLVSTATVANKPKDFGTQKNSANRVWLQRSLKKMLH